MRTVPSNCRGALLVEALVALAVFALGILGNVSLLAHTARAVSAAHWRMEAARLAQAQIAAMWTANPDTLAARYDKDAGGEAYAKLAELAQKLPGADIAGNAPEVSIGPGPAPRSRKVSVTLHWQLPGERVAHRYRTSAVIAGG